MLWPMAARLLSTATNNNQCPVSALGSRNFGAVGSGPSGGAVAFTTLSSPQQQLPIVSQPPFSVTSDYLPACEAASCIIIQA